jgi:hypothetical protein
MKINWPMQNIGYMRHLKQTMSLAVRYGQHLIGDLKELTVIALSTTWYTWSCWRRRPGPTTSPVPAGTRCR